MYSFRFNNSQLLLATACYLPECWLALQMFNSYYSRNFLLLIQQKKHSNSLTKLVPHAAILLKALLCNLETQIYLVAEINVKEFHNMRHISLLTSTDYTFMSMPFLVCKMLTIIILN